MGTVLVEGKTLFPRARKKAPSPDTFLMIDRILSLAAESNVSASLAILEIDHAWALQVKHGSDTLRRVLKKLATLLRDETPEELLYDRWGPAGFICVYPGGKTKKTRRIVERIAGLLEIQMKGILEGDMGTFSAGVAQFPDHGSTRVELLHHAEEAVYTAQKSGPNRIELPPDENPQEISVPLSIRQIERLTDLADREAAEVQELIIEAIDEYLRRINVNPE